MTAQRGSVLLGEREFPGFLIDLELLGVSLGGRP
jgi:hypothetical protein